MFSGCWIVCSLCCVWSPLSNDWFPGATSEHDSSLSRWCNSSKSRGAPPSASALCPPPPSSRRYSAIITQTPTPSNLISRLLPHPVLSLQSSAGKYIKKEKSHDIFLRQREHCNNQIWSYITILAISLGSHHYTCL